VDDVLAAADFLAKQEGVDSSRIYLGGHSTGGTLALLVAAAAPQRFRAVFSFGPVADVAGYGPDELTFDANNQKERELRAPMLWLDPVKSPTFVFEGGRRGNADSVREIQQATNNPAVQSFIITRGDHFSILAPVTRVIASKITKDTGSTPNLRFTQAELDGVVR
jgi:acetyl esterase/lipase